MIAYLDTAARLASSLRSADAIDLVTAQRVNAEVLIAYDRELCAAAMDAGLDVSSPGLSS